MKPQQSGHSHKFVLGV